MSASTAYIVAARRSANGLVGGLHRARRLEDLAAPVLAETLGDAHIAAGQADLVTFGNTSGGGNPARVLALLAGLRDDVQALSIDRQAVSGLEAIVLGLERIAAGDVHVVAAGGGEALSMAPWRIARPRTLAQTPRFISPTGDEGLASGHPAESEAADALATRLRLTRRQQDEFALACHIRAGLARDQRRFLKEIVALKSRGEETRDEPTGDLEIDDFESAPPLNGDGSVTAANSSPAADGAAFVIAVSETVYQQLGRPPALRLSASVSLGVPSAREAEAPILAGQRLVERLGPNGLDGVDAVELGETSAVQALAFQSALALPDGRINADGGQIARGNPIGAAGAVLVVRLFSRLVRAPDITVGARGLAVIGSSGQAMACMFERV